MQNFGGIGRSSRSSFADVDGDVNGKGTCPPRSAVEHETMKNPASRIRCRYMKYPFMFSFLQGPLTPVEQFCPEPEEKN